MKTLNRLHQKDHGIALIFSLFFLIILFAIGVTLLFRAQMNRKTATALANNDLDKLRAQGAIGIVQNTISVAMKDKTSPSFDSVFDQVADDQSVLADEFTLRSSGYKGGATSLTAYNGTNSNLANGTTQSMFDFSHDGTDLTSISANTSGNSVEWLVYTSQGELVDQSTGRTVNGSSINNGDDGFRLSYLIIDQTGKINPNMAVDSSGSNGINFNALALSTSTPFSLDSIFQGGSTSSTLFTGSTQFQNIKDLYEYIDSSGMSATDKNTASESFYPYSNTVIEYPEQSTKFSSSSTITDKLNLHDLYDLNGAFYSGLSDDDAAVNKIIDSIPYLKLMTEQVTETVDHDSLSTVPDPTLTNTDSWGEFRATATAENIPLNKKIAANLKDYIDNDVIATTNFEINPDGSIPTWNSLPNSVDQTEVYCGHEGVAITALTFIAFDHIDTSVRFFSYNLIDPATSPSIMRSTFIYPVVEVSVDIDLDQNDINTLEVAPNQTNKTGKLRAYVSYDATFKTAHVVNQSKWSPPSSAPKDELLDTNITKTIEYVTDIKNSYPELNKDQPSTTTRWTYWLPSTTNIAQRGNFYNAAAAGINGNTPSSINLMDFGSTYNTPVTPIYDPAVDGVTHNGGIAENFKGYACYDIVLKFPRPIILFFDLNNNYKPDNGEIVDLVQLPQRTWTHDNLNGTSINTLYLDELASGATPSLPTLPPKRNVVKFHPTGDPRNNTLRNTWTQYYLEPTAGSKIFSWDSNSHDGLTHYTQYPLFLREYMNPYRQWTFNDASLTSYLDPSEMVLRFPDTDHEPVWEIHNGNIRLREVTLFDGTVNREGAIVDPLEISTMSNPFDADTKKFGGIRSLAEIGRVSRGEHWKTLNLSFFALPSTPGSVSKYSDFDGTQGYPASNPTSYLANGEEDQDLNDKSKSSN